MVMRGPDENVTDNRTHFNKSHYDDDFGITFYRHSQIITIVYCIGYLTVFVLGLIGNCLVVAVVCRTPRMRTVTNYFIANLAFADILVVLLSLPASLLSSIFNRKWFFMPFVCV